MKEIKEYLIWATRATWCWQPQIYFHNNLQASWILCNKVKKRKHKIIVKEVSWPQHWETRALTADIRTRKQRLQHCLIKRTDHSLIKRKRKFLPCPRVLITNLSQEFASITHGSHWQISRQESKRSSPSAKRLTSQCFRMNKVICLENWYTLIWTMMFRPMMNNK